MGEVSPIDRTTPRGGTDRVLAVSRTTPTTKGSQRPFRLNPPDPGRSVPRRRVQRILRRRFSQRVIV